MMLVRNENDFKNTKIAPNMTILRLLGGGKTVKTPFIISFTPMPCLIVPIVPSTVAQFEFPCRSFYGHAATSCLPCWANLAYLTALHARDTPW